MEQLKSELAEQTRAIIREMMGEIMGIFKQKQPVQQQSIDLDAKNSGKRQMDNDVANRQADMKWIFPKL